MKKLLLPILFDKIITKYHCFKYPAYLQAPNYNALKYLGIDATILGRHAKFKQAVVKIQLKKENTLTVEEVDIMEKFLKEPNLTTQSNNERLTEEEQVSEFLNSALQKKNTKNSSISNYVNLNFISPTSNDCERDFSTAKLINTSQRHSMNPLHFECAIMLKKNPTYWNHHSVMEARNNLKRRSEINEDE